MWSNAFKAGRCAAAVVLAAVLFPTVAPAQTRFDGAWSVLVVTDYGSCDRAYRYGIRIQNGRVFYDGQSGADISGRVSPRGDVRVVVRQGDQQANGAGRLSADSGEGQWRGASPEQGCGGHWIAERRGY